MARYTLSKNYSEIAETCGIFQNVSGNAEIEITDDISEAGIILRPFQTVIVHQKVFARKLGNSGACLLQVLPFRELYEHYDNENFGDYGDLIFNHHRPPPDFNSNAPLAVQETPTHYLVTVSKNSLKGQKKFLIQFDDKMKGR